MSEDAAAQPSSLLLEQWGSMLLGAFWQRQLAAGPGLNSLAPSGEPVLKSIAAIGNADAKLALVTLGRLDRGELGLRAGELADRLSWPLPPWVAGVGTARLVRAFSASRRSDGEVIMFESDGAGPLGHMLAVYIDARHGGIAKQLRLLRPVDPLELNNQFAGESGCLKFRVADLSAMCEKTRQAIIRTDAAVHPPVDDSFSDYRAIARARLDPLDR